MIFEEGWYTEETELMDECCPFEVPYSQLTNNPPIPCSPIAIRFYSNADFGDCYDFRGGIVHRLNGINRRTHPVVASLGTLNQISTRMKLI